MYWLVSKFRNLPPEQLLFSKDLASLLLISLSLTITIGFFLSNRRDIHFDGVFIIEINCHTNTKEERNVIQNNILYHYSIV